VQLGGTRISVDVTCLWSTRQPVYRFAQACGYRRHEPITGLDVERGNLPWGGLDEVFRGAVGKVTSGYNHEGEYQDPWQGRSSS
jgi:hypothetical protein